MRVKISTESASDLSKELTETFGIDVIAMNITVDDKTYKDGVSLSTDEMLESKSTASTAAVNIEEYSRFFESVLADGFEIVHVALSSKLSSTYQNAVIAARRFDSVHVVDSLNLSAGAGLLAVIGAQLAESGMSAAEIAKILEKKKADIKTSFVLEDIDRLRRGGRCTAIEALGANLLGIKPSVNVEDGKLVPAKRYYGRGAAARLRYIENKIKADDPDRSVCFLNHSLENGSEVQKLKSLLETEYGFEQVYVNRAGCCISAHCGKNCMGVIYFRGYKRVKGS